MPSVFELVYVTEIPILTDKIECSGIKNNWKVFFRMPGDVERKIRSYTFRIKSPLIPPEIDFKKKRVEARKLIIPDMKKAF